MKINTWLEALLALDQQLLLWLNSLHTAWLDVWMIRFTGTLFWLPLYVILLLWCVYKYRWHTVWIVLGVVICVSVANELTSWLKYTVGRMRPCYAPEIEMQVRAIVGCGGWYGFPSAHAANSFGVWFFLKNVLAERPIPRGIIDPTNYLQWILLLYALLHTYSRIYLGVHYPLDIIVGLGLGIGIAWGLSHIYTRVRGRYPRLRL